MSFPKNIRSQERATRNTGIGSDISLEKRARFSGGAQCPNLAININRLSNAEPLLGEGEGSVTGLDPL